MGVVFHKDLVEDIAKLRFSYGENPTTDIAHKGITPLEFFMMSIAEEQQLRINEEVYEFATNITPQASKAANRNPPPFPDTYEKLRWLLRQYIKAGRSLFMQKNGHLQEMHHTKKELM